MGFGNILMGGSKGWTFKNHWKSMTFCGIKAVAHSYGSGTADWNLSESECGASYISCTLAGGAVNAIIPAAHAIAGKVYVLYNNSGANVTLKVSGQTGIAVATTKMAILVCNGTDIARVTADT